MQGFERKMTIKSGDKSLVMSWYALENLDKAMEETKELLLPFDLMTWTKIAIIALFAGGISMPNAPSAPMQSPGQTDQVYTPDSGINQGMDTSMSDAFSSGMNGMTGMATSGVTDGLAIAIILAVLLFAGFFMYISSVFQFIYYQTILDKKTAITENFRKHAYRGLRYFGFQIGFMLFILLTLLIPAAGFAANEALGFLMLIVFWIPVVIVSAIFSGLVHDVALLRMMEAEEGLIRAWRNVWPDIKAEWKQVLAFIVVKFFIGLAVGFASLIIAIVVGITLLLPFGLLGILAGMVHSVLLAVVFAVGLLTFVVIMLYVEVPFSTYIYTYITLFYHDLTS